MTPNPTNIVYSMLMMMVSGPGITFPQGKAANDILRIDTNVLRQIILHSILIGL